MNDISTPMMNLLEKFLDVTTQRHKLVVSNMANIDTPGYRPRTLIFGANCNARYLTATLPCRRWFVRYLLSSGRTGTTSASIAKDCSWLKRRCSLGSECSCCSTNFTIFCLLSMRGIKHEHFLTTRNQRFCSDRRAPTGRGRGGQHGERG